MHALTALDPDGARVIAAFSHYMGAQAFTFPELSANLRAKLEDRDFRGDLAQLVTVLPESYDPDRAADTVMERLGSRLAGAPDPPEIRGGAWRR